MKNKRKHILEALDKVNKEIEGFASSGGKYARGLASEGCNGGYRDALYDVLLLMNGVVPYVRWWRD